jgi:glycosyltransferase involved in cell wall biosynthesis/SAM-dependent methyltransferase
MTPATSSPTSSPAGGRSAAGTIDILTVADVSPLAVAGGSERVLWELASRLAASGHRVRIVGRAVDRGSPAVVDRAGVRVRHFAASGARLGFVGGTIARARAAVAAELGERRPDVLHLHQPLSGVGALAAAGASGVPALYTFHSSAALEYRARRGMTRRHVSGPAGAAATALLWALERACLGRAGRIHALSAFSARQLWALHGIARDRIAIVPGGVDLARFSPPADVSATRRRLGLPEDRPLLLTVRDLEPRMGLDVLLRAVARAREEAADALVLIGGRGWRERALRALAAELGLDDHVRFLGFVPEADLADYYRAADAFVLPTRELEGFGLVTVEALACGTPVVGTSAGATPEILSALDPGLLVPPEDPAALARALVDIVHRVRHDRAGIADLRDRCRRLAERRYDWTRAVDALAVELGALASPARQPPASGPCAVCSGEGRRRRLVHQGERYHGCRRCGAWRMASLPQPPERRAGGRLVAATATGGWRAVAIDLPAVACRADRRRGSAPGVEADAAALPIRTAAVDAVTLVNVLDHTRSPLDALREAARVLRPGGQLAVRVPNGALHARLVRALALLGVVARLRGWSASPVLHVHALGPRALRRIVERAGFEVIAMRNSPAARDTRAGRAVRGIAAAVAAVSGGRWLLGPSIEVHGRRRG